MRKWMKLIIFSNTDFYIYLLLWYIQTKTKTRDMQSEQSKVPSPFLGVNTYSAISSKLQFWKKHLKSTKIAQTTPKFDVHLPLIIAFRPVQSEMQYDFFWRNEEKIRYSGFESSKIIKLTINLPFLTQFYFLDLISSILSQLERQEFSYYRFDTRSKAGNLDPNTSSAPRIRAVTFCDLLPTK